VILICYDGSDDAKAAIAHGGELLRGQAATVLTVWEPFARVLTRYPTGLGPMAGLASMEEIDEISGKEAERRAQEGADLARQAGLDARPRTCSEETSMADAILSEAEALAASAIPTGLTRAHRAQIDAARERLTCGHAAGRSGGDHRALPTGRGLARPRATRDRRIALTASGQRVSAFAGPAFDPQIVPNCGDSVVRRPTRRRCTDGRRTRAAHSETMATRPPPPRRL
jgi:Universal stress protein family